MPGSQGYLLASLWYAVLFAIIEAILYPVFTLLFGPRYQYFSTLLFVDPLWALFMAWLYRSVIRRGQES